MTTKVKIPFHDVNNFSVVYEKDTIVEFDDERAKELIRLKLVAPVVEEVKKRGRKVKESEI